MTFEQRDEAARMCDVHSITRALLLLGLHRRAPHSFGGTELESNMLNDVFESRLAPSSVHSFLPLIP